MTGTILIYIVVALMLTDFTWGWQFRGSFQTATGQCLAVNPLNQQCACFDQDLSTSFSILSTNGETFRTNVSVCWLDDRLLGDGSFGGIFQLDETGEGTVGCRTPNLATVACTCPFGFAEIIVKSLVDISSGGSIVSDIVFCYNPTGALEASWFGGVFQQLDSGVCHTVNPLTGACSCPFEFKIQEVHALSERGEGSTIAICTPPSPPIAHLEHELVDTLVVYISTNGSDSNNGSTVETAFASIGHALLFVQEHRLPNQNATLRILQGAYHQSKAIEWNGTSCGSRQYGTFVSLVAFPAGARVVVSGGTPDESFAFVSHGGPIDWYTAILSNDVAQSFVWQLWRETSSLSYERISLVSRTTEEYLDLLSTTPPIQFSIPRNQSPVDVAASFAYMYHSWTSTINAVESFNSSSGVVTLLGSASDNAFNSASGNRYRFVNLPLDLGETAPPWTYHFNSSSRRVLLAVPAGLGSPPTIIVPTLSTILSIQNGCANVILDGITFAHSDSFLDQCLANGCSGQSGSFLSSAAVELKNQVSFASLTNVEIAHVGGYGLWVHEATNTITVRRCSLHDLGAGGIRIGEPQSGTIGNRSLLATNVIVSDTTILDGGHIIEAGAGVLLQQAASCVIEHCLIGELFYTGISTGWTWGYAATSNNNIVVQKNEIFNIGRGVLSDMGCIYNLGISPGTTMNNNICHDLQSFGYGGWGLYSDEGTSFVTWSNNVVYRTKSAPYHQHYGLSNTIVNNVFAFPEVTLGLPYPVSDFAAVRSSPSPSGHEHDTSFSLTRNIVLLRNASATLFFSTIPDAFINVTANNNVYFNLESPTSALRFPCFAGSEQEHCIWSEWQHLGEDKDSVLANPEFTNASLYDFSHLSPNSPALALGFVPINTSGVGPR